MKLSGWGRYPCIEAQGRSFETCEELHQHLDNFAPSIAFGLGRSYGDSALGANVLLTRRFDKLHHFDALQGILTCESGVTLAELIRTFVPRGWFLPVTPGTKFITVGGAIAADVHGKNHHTAGCFSECLVSFHLVMPEGKVLRCSKEENPELFRATCGGMGLTGVIADVTLRLQPIASAFMRETVIRCRNLQEVFQRFEEHDSMPYSVAWIDCLARGEHLGRSILMLGEHAHSGRMEMLDRGTFTLPMDFPAFCMNRYSVALFNHLYMKSRPDYAQGRPVHLDDFFYPLDSIGRWNRMYGSRGFCQYQFVLPKPSSLVGVQEILHKIGQAGMGSFLAVLKLLGPQNRNLLSFPREGYTLALDFKIQRTLFPFLRELDDIVLDHGGRLYLAKDARMPQEMFKKSYSQWERLSEIRERHGLTKKFASLQSKRLGV